MKIRDAASDQEIDFGFPDKYTKPGIWLSGGADSAVLLYILIRYLQETGRESNNKITVMTCANHEKLRWNTRHATNIIDKIVQLTGATCIERHVTIYRDVQAVDYFRELDTEMMDGGQIDILINGLTKNPPQGVSVENINGQMVDLYNHSHKVASRDQPDGVVLDLWKHTAWYSPFLVNDKRLIAAAYDSFGLRHNLLPLTRSCEEIPEVDELGNKTLDEKPCGKCWWCLERKWAFGHW